MSKHVTFWRMRLQPGKFDDMRRAMDAENEESRMKAAGWQATVVGQRKENPDEIWGCVTWDNSENYKKNAESPEQNAWFERMSALFASPPEWFDCDVVEERRA